MGTAISLDDELIELARSYSAAQHRSVPKQIAHWAKIGRIAEDNPELSYALIKDILIGLKEVKKDQDQLEDYDTHV